MTAHDACQPTFVPNALIERLALVCRERLLEEKWLIVPSIRVGHQWLQSVARTGQPAVNVRLKTLRSLAIDLAGPVLAERGLTLLTPLAGTVMVQQLLSGGELRLEYLNQNAGTWSMAELIYRALDDLRMAGIDPGSLEGSRIEPPAKAADLRRAYEAYLAALRQADHIDLAGLFELARARLAAGAAPLPASMLLLIPADLELRGVARTFIEAFPAEVRHVLHVDALPDATGGTAPAQVGSDRELLCWIHRPQPLPRPAHDGTLRIVRAVGEVNEVRQVFRWCLARQVPLDRVEVLYTEAQTYVPLVYEELVARYGTMELESLPVTFAEGLPARFSRPGRLLRLWLQWVQEDYPQSLLVLMIQDGLLNVPWPEQIPEAQRSHSRLARRLARLNVGLGRDRYLRILQADLSGLQNQQRPEDQDAPLLEEREHTLRQDEARTLVALAQGLLELLPAGARGKDFLNAASRLLAEHARCISQLDNFAVGRLRQELQQLGELLGDGDAAFDVPAYLGRLLEATVQGSGPRPGAVHVASLISGGHSGRPYTWVLGLDDGRFPGAGLQDPLLLDGDRWRLSHHLTTSQAHMQEKLRRFAELGARLRGELTLSYSTLSLSDNRQLFPSPVVLSAFRLLAEQPEGDLAALERWLPEPPAAFAPGHAEECLSTSEWWQWRLLCGGGSAQQVEQAFPHLAQGARAATARSSPAFTEFDGNVPEAARVLDLTAGRPVSAKELEMLGACPLRFFFCYGLEILPPDEPELDLDQWLDAPRAGQLLHSLFERFMGEIINAGRLPNVTTDQPRLEALLNELIRSYRTLHPPANEAAFSRRVNELRETARNFLLEECRYIQTCGAQPVWMETALGLPHLAKTGSLDTPEPLPIVLADGRTLQLCGRIDRIDRVASIDRLGSGVPAVRRGTRATAVETYCVWDYKTGSSSRYNRADPFRQGRNLQPYLYLTMVAHRLQQHQGAKVRVERFGFFFPGARAAGERLHWSADQLREGSEVVTRLCQVVSQGSFLATECKEDCEYCDYQRICGDAEAIAAASRLKLDESGDPRLEALRVLRPPRSSAE